LPDLQITLYELLVAFFIASGVGIVAGFFISRSRYTTEVLDPLLAAMYAIPAVVLFPLYVLLFGIGPASKMAMGATIAFFPVVLNTISGFRTVPRAYVIAAQSLGASPAQMFWSVMLPAVFPAVLTGLRMGMILAFLSIIGTEMISSFSGLGHRIVQLAESMDSAAMFAYIFLVLLIALVLNAATSVAEARRRRETA
jgi:ABC-type nitrate/sulfonate/bicarbonate transport system permease component